MRTISWIGPDGCPETSLAPCDRIAAIPPGISATSDFEGLAPAEKATTSPSKRPAQGTGVPPRVVRELELGDVGDASLAGPSDREVAGFRAGSESSRFGVPDMPSSLASALQLSVQLFVRTHSLRG